MRIYLAGKFEEAPTIKAYADELRRFGHTISYPWFELHTKPGVPDLTLESIEDVEGVKSCDAAIFIFEKNLPYSGAMTELGLALAWNKYIVVVGHGGDRNIFTKHPDVVHVETWKECHARFTPVVQ